MLLQASCRCSGLHRSCKALFHIPIRHSQNQMPVDGKNLRRFVEDITGKSPNAGAGARPGTAHTARDAPSVGHSVPDDFPDVPARGKVCTCSAPAARRFASRSSWRHALCAAETKKSPPAPGEPHCALRGHASRRIRRRGSSCLAWCSLAWCSWHGDGATGTTSTARPRPGRRAAGGMGRPRRAA